MTRARRQDHGRRWLASLGTIGALLGCGSPSGSSASSSVSAPSVSTEAPALTSEPAGPALDGAALVRRFECARCHDDSAAVASVPVAKHCYGCHDAIATNQFKAPEGARVSPAILTKWKSRVENLRFAPSLSGVGTLVREEWARDFLLAPYDVRPHLHGMMPRLAITKEEATAIVRYLAASSPSPGEEAPRGSAERGAKLFEEKACGGCHELGGGSVKTTPPRGETGDAAHVLAPDLRFARKRLVPGRLVAYLLDPRSVKAGAAMPKIPMTREEAHDLATFVLEVPLAAPAEEARRPRLPVLERPVGYDEVSARVFNRICWHCHSQPDYARGDGGPGNSGGFGFPARGLDLSSYESIASGIVGRDGERMSVFSDSGGTPLLLAALLARHEEVRGAEPGRVRGMPLGLPPLSIEDIQLVETWIAQGHPR
jgi:mono/diheme cytochrome c family protein